jgi:hypothetical protein
MAKKTTETIEREVYVWNCPVCGERMWSQCESFADSVCANCVMKADAEKFRLHTKYLIGARIIDVDGDYYSSGDTIDSVVLATTNGEQIVISGRAYCESDPSIEIGKVEHPIKTERTIEKVLQNCAKLRGVHGLSWRTLHEFFWFVSMSKWGNRECYTEEEHGVYRNFNGRPVGLNVSFDKMLLDEALLFEEYCENEYGDD